MTEPDPTYQPDVIRTHRQEAHRAAPKPPLTVDKPISMRVMKTRPATLRKHYKRKAPPTVDRFDPRNVKFY